MVLRVMKRISIGNLYYNGCDRGKILTTTQKSFSLATNNPEKEMSLIKKNIRKPINKRLSTKDIKVIRY